MIKRKLIVLFMILLSFAMVGCNNQNLEFGEKYNMIDNHNLEKVRYNSNFEIDRKVEESSNEFFPAEIISDKMVLQRNAVNKLWGEAYFEGDFAVEINKNIFYGTAQNNEFEIYLEPMKVGGPYDLTFYGPTTKYVIKDVMVGEVILFSGQSNMQWKIGDTLFYGKQDLKQEGRPSHLISYLPTLENDPETYFQYYLTNEVKQKFIDDTRAEIVDNNAIRLALLDADYRASQIPYNLEPQSRIWVKWEEAEEETIYRTSMFAYYFAKELQKHTNMTIGVIVGSWGGTFASAWVPEEVVNENLDIFKYINGGGANEIGLCYNTFIAPILNYKTKAVVWYQGEGQTNKYAESIVKLIETWREKMDNPNLGFQIVQLPRYGVGSIMPEGVSNESYGTNDKYVGLVNKHLFENREQQKLIPTMINNVTMSVSIDQGDHDDIHPTDKRIIAKYAENQFVKYFYESEEILSGPVISDYYFDNDDLVIEFTNTGGNIVIKNNGINFEISEDGNKFYEVRASRMTDNSIVLSKGTTPISQINYVRYGALEYPRLSRIDMSLYLSIYNNSNYPLDQFLLKTN